MLRKRKRSKARTATANISIRDPARSDIIRQMVGTTPCDTYIERPKNQVVWSSNSYMNAATPASRTGQQQNVQHQTVHGWKQKMRETPIIGVIENFIKELWPTLTSDFISESLLSAKRALAESPCSTLLYILLIFFGCLPIMCFFLFLCATLILWLVCFIFCQAIAVTFAGVLCAGLFFTIVVASCFTATAFGLTVHTLSFMGYVYRVIVFNAPETMAYLRQQLAKWGIHLRLPEDDQT